MAPDHSLKANVSRGAPQTDSAGQERILIIKLGALGNIVLSFQAFAAIRQFHPTAHIAVLTAKAFAPWMRLFPWFDEVVIDPRPAWWDWSGLRQLGQLLTDKNFTRVYDLQTSARSSRYFYLFPPKHRPAWSGIAFGCSLPDRNPNRNRLHDAERQLDQLRQAGITTFPKPDMSWCHGDTDRLGLPTKFALLVPGSSPQRPGKRWPASCYESVAATLAQRGTATVAIGSAAEERLIESIPSAMNLVGQTSLGDIADLGRKACFAIGNDTGPMHLIAAVGCPTITLFSGESDPALCSPVGEWTRVVRRPALTDLSIEDVLQSLPTE
jgi:ADP-heptose:LPS heptosyltransferase